MNNRGFTLIETMVYIALFAILMSGAVASTYSLLEGGSRNQASVSVQEEGTFLNRKINWALTGASAVGVSGGGTTLTITRPDLGAQSPLIIIGDGTSVSIKRGGAGVLAVGLNSDRFPVSNPASGPMFSVQTGSGGKPDAVTASFVISGKPFLFRTYVRQ